MRLIGRSEAIRTVESEVESAAQSDAQVLITGETGVGKALIARLIHHRSARASAPLHTLNCAGLPDWLLESELFGHMRGSFTGAYSDKPGLLEMAPHGSLFIDEVGEMSPRMQGALLHFLESGEIQRIGADRSHVRVNVRLITATTCDLEAHVAAGDFRQDLYVRLSIIRVHVLPLRQRTEDIPLLVRHFLRSCRHQHKTAACDVSPEAIGVLEAHRRPGNIGELKHVFERVALTATRQVVGLDDLPLDVIRSVAARSGAPASAGNQPTSTERSPHASPRISTAPERPAPRRV